ncbi:hypothetical protein HK102_010343 [Quaeritorhiza haematococci]|nr:hypothetical protein HK102_010343 [Quaeritorhiza haematococci]
MSIWQPLFENELLSDPFFRDPFGTIFGQPMLERGNHASENAGQTSQDMQRMARRNQLNQWLRAPRMDVKETENQYIIKADLPGLTKDQVHIHVQDDVLVIEGERKQEKEERDERRHLVERSFGRFSRRIRLPEDTNMNDANAKMENGVLELTFGKTSEKEKRMKIEIK